METQDVSNELTRYGNATVVTSSIFGGVTFSNRRMIADRNEVDFTDAQATQLLAMLLGCYGTRALGTILSTVTDAHFDGDAEADHIPNNQGKRIGDFEVYVCPTKEGFAGVELHDAVHKYNSFTFDLTHNDVADILRHVMRSK